MAARKNEVVTEVPKELSDLRSAIRSAIILRDSETLEERIRAAEAIAIAAITGGSSTPIRGSVPGQDSGEALIGHWCFLWDNQLLSNCSIYKVSSFDGSRPSEAYRGEDEDGDTSCGYAHARPIKLGLPDASNG